MFSSSYKSVSAYRQVGVETDVSGADPHKLVMLLFEGAQAAIAMAKTSMEQGDTAKKGTMISRAIDIIDNGLKAGIDLEKGQEIAERLVLLYEYMAGRLFHANLKNDLAALNEVAHLLGEIQSAWAEIRPQVIGSQDTSPEL